MFLLRNKVETWFRARDLSGIKIPLISGGLELRISCIQKQLPNPPSCWVACNSNLVRFFSMLFFFSRYSLFLSVNLFFCKSIIRPYMKYCYSWVGAPTCYVDLLDKLQKHRRLLILVFSNPCHNVEM